MSMSKDLEKPSHPVETTVIEEQETTLEPHQVDTPTEDVKDETGQSEPDPPEN